MKLHHEYSRFLQHTLYCILYTAHFLGEYMADKQVSLLLFEVEGKKLLMDIADLVEIIPIQNITRLPNAGKNIAGMTNYRGEVIGVFNAAEILAIPKKNKGHKSIIVVKYNKDKFGIPSNRVHEVVYLPAASIKSGKAELNKEELQVISLKDFTF